MSKFYINLMLLICAACLLTVTVSAQETESASKSNLTNVSLPANAERVLPGSVPKEVTESLEKFVAVGEGKLRQGETEVLVWAGASYKKANAASTVNHLTETLENAGWKYEISGVENGVTVFTALKEGQRRRALVGFYGVTDDALVLAWTEILSANSSKNRTENDSQNERIETASAPRTDGSLREIVGEWHNGNVSMMQEKNLTTGQITSSNGSTVTYKFFADGRFEYIGYLKSTMYGCTTDLFNDKRGTVEISGNQITLVPTKNYWKNTYSCSPASNKERNYVLDRETYTFRTKTDEYGKTLICLANAKGESCYRREK